ncbi:MAG: 2-amino-4-hydroxy-6-hydroxymethyldihydropteridine diphosphokinase [Deltaproteobacteria bacterium]|nr:2-amino-4-hydroxy-6-hydroxymethyldihydropteridine diphosphokinase [Deltaproteobacteria bacterium]
MMHTAFLSIGSNIGDSVKNCQNTIKSIAGHEEMEVIRVSSFYSTEPWGDIEQEWFTNCVVKIKTSLHAFQLLRHLQQIERDLGREEFAKGLPRVIDIDILFFDNAVIGETILTIPHPHLHKRAFVLVPLMETDPLHIHPVIKKNIRELNQELEDRKKVIRIE